MKLPRDLSGRDLAKGLARLGYQIDHQTGSHIRLTRAGPPEHHVTIPDHAALKIGTLSAILRLIGEHTKLTRNEILQTISS